MLTRAKLIFHTLKYLRFKQLYYQVYYRFRRRLFRRSYRGNPPKSARLHWDSSIESQTSWDGKNSFTFLNLTETFDPIDWNTHELKQYICNAIGRGEKVLLLVDQHELKRDEVSQVKSIDEDPHFRIMNLVRRKDMETA